jgi:hypothetical protein
MYDDSLARPAPPIFWIVLSGALGLCCIAFFCTSAVETYWLMNGYTLVMPASSGDKPALGAITFYTNQTSDGQPVGAALTRVSTGAKTVYAYFSYRNMPKTPLTWSYAWTLDGADLTGASKSGQRWTRDGSGVYFLKLSDDKGLKPGVYELVVDLADQEQTASFTVGP